MTLFQISVIIILFSLSWHIMLLPGSLLQGVALYINTKFEGTLLRKALMCPYCFAGQLGFWVAVIMFFTQTKFNIDGWVLSVKGDAGIFILPIIVIPVVFAIVEGAILLGKLFNEN